MQEILEEIFMVKESTIRLMTRLSDQYKAINLGQGFTDEAAIYEMVWGAIAASIGGTEEGISELNTITTPRAGATRGMPTFHQFVDL